MRPLYSLQLCAPCTLSSCAPPVLSPAVRPLYSLQVCAHLTAKLYVFSSIRGDEPAEVLHTHDADTALALTRV